MKKQFIIYVSLALLSLAACVTDFTPEVKGVSGILVVDGTITDGESVFRLSRSVGITDDIPSEPERWDHGRYPFRRYDHER